MNPFIEAKFGRVDLDLISASGPIGRDFTVHSPSRGSEHVFQDRGRRLERVSATIIFAHRGGSDDHLARYFEFKELVDAGAREVFSHPLGVSYLAFVDGAEFEASDDGTITVSLTFAPVIEPIAVRKIGASLQSQAGPASVALAAAAVPASAGIDGAGIVAKVEGWATAAADSSRLAAAELASVSAEIDAAIEGYAAATDPQSWEIYRALIALRYECELAAASLASSPTLTEITIAAAIPLRVFCVTRYGVDGADAAELEIRKANRVSEPGLLRAGQVLLVPPKGTK